MVIPMERRKSDSESSVKKHVGNGLKLHIQSNNSLLLVVGNDCSLLVEENNSDIRIVGENSRVTIKSGSGKVNCIGNNAKFFLAPGVARDLVTCVGNNCEIVTGTVARKISGGGVGKSRNGGNPNVSVTNSRGSRGISISNMNNFELFNESYFRGSLVPKVSVRVCKIPKSK